jgi:hypothetical protein
MSRHCRELRIHGDWLAWLPYADYTNQQLIREAQNQLGIKGNWKEMSSAREETKSTSGYQFRNPD